MLESDSSLKCLFNQKGLAYAAATIDGDKLRTITLIVPLQFLYHLNFYYYNQYEKVVS